jgi:1-acyl-sn-glycerol-3-phosphate acyltransferase
MIRILLIVIFLVPYFLLSIPTWGIIWLIAKKNQELADRISMECVRFAFRVIIFLSGTKVHVTGQDNIPTDKPVVYIANHRGLFDIVTTYVYMPRPTGFIAKKEVEKVPLLRVWMRYIKCLFLDRKDLKAGMKTLLTGVKQIKAGHSMYICPEGTRNKGQELLPFKNGSFVLASKSGSPVIPVAIKGTDNVFENNHPKRITKADVYLSFGTPFYIADLPQEDQDNIGEYTRRLVQKLLDAM